MLKASVLSLIQEIKREIMPERERLEVILEEVGINDPPTCNDEIESLERASSGRSATAPRRDGCAAMLPPVAAAYLPA